MADRSREEFSLHPAWHALGLCLAAAGGALVALLSLLNHVPAWVACLRGGATWWCMRLVVRAGIAALGAAMAGDAARSDEAGAGERS